MSSTTIAILAVVTTVPAFIHICGWDETTAGKIITSILVDIAGAYKAAKKDSSDE